jgi:hypothetical protein
MFARRKSFGLSRSGKFSDKLSLSELKASDVIPEKDTSRNPSANFGQGFDVSPNVSVRIRFDKGHANIPNPIESGFIVERINAPTFNRGSQSTTIGKFKTGEQARQELIKVLKKAKKIDE